MSSEALRHATLTILSFAKTRYITEGSIQSTVPFPPDISHGKVLSKVTVYMSMRTRRGSEGGFTSQGKEAHAKFKQSTFVFLRILQTQKRMIRTLYLWFGILIIYA